MTENQQKVLVYGLAYLLNNAEALHNGMDQNLPPSDVLTPNDVLRTIEELIKENRDGFDRWGLGHLFND